MKSSFEKLIASDKPILIDFFAEWCGPCKSLAPILTELKTELGSKARVVKIDIDKNQVLAGKLGIKGVPHLMLYKAGDLKWSGSGLRSKHELSTIIKGQL